MTHRFLGLIVACTLLAGAACSKGGSTVASPTGNGTGGGAVAPSAPGTGAPASPPVTAPPGTASVSPRSTPSGTPAPPPPPPGEATQETPPATGTYVYTQSGHASYGQGGAYRVDYPDQGKLTVQGAILVPGGQEQLQIRDVSDQFREERTLHWLEGRIALRKYVAKYRVAGNFQQFACELPDPPTLFVTPLRTGSSWSDEGACDDASFHVSATVARTERVKIGTETLDTFVVTATIKVTSEDITQTTESTYWLSPRYRLAAKSRSHSEGTFRGLPTDGDFAETLVSTTPA